jgi:hypothetical protein
VFIYGSLKNLAIRPRFKIQTKSTGEPDIVCLDRTLSGWEFLFVDGGKRFEIT